MHWNADGELLPASVVICCICCRHQDEVRTIQREVKLLLFFFEYSSYAAFYRFPPLSTIKTETLHYRNPMLYRNSRCAHVRYFSQLGSWLRLSRVFNTVSPILCLASIVAVLKRSHVRYGASASSYIAVEVARTFCRRPFINCRQNNWILVVWHVTIEPFSVSSHCSF